MNAQNDLAERTLIKIRDYKLHSAEFQEKGFLSYPQFQQFVRSTLNEYFSAVGGELARPAAHPVQDT